jgi:hypothetical protein
MAAGAMVEVKLCSGHNRGLGRRIRILPGAWRSVDASTAPMARLFSKGQGSTSAARFTYPFFSSTKPPRKIMTTVNKIPSRNFPIRFLLPYRLILNVASQSPLGGKPIVFLQHFPQLIMRQCFDGVAVGSGHRLRRYHRVHYRFFGRLRGSLE